VFAIAQGRHSGRIVGVTCQVIPAEPFHGNDAAFGQQSPGGLNSVASCVVAKYVEFGFSRGYVESGFSRTCEVRLEADATYQLILRTTRRTGDRLRMKSPVLRVGVLRRAVGTQRPTGHRGPRAVVRQGSDNREPWTAAGAIDVRIPISSIG